LDILSRSGDIRDQSRRLYKIDRNLACFGPQFFLGVGGELPEFLESIYEIDTGFDHVAKFRGDRPRELGDYALKKRKHHEQNRRPPVILHVRTGGLMTHSVFCYLCLAFHQLKLPFHHLKLSFQHLAMPSRLDGPHCIFVQLIFGKIITIVATRCQILRRKYTKYYFGWGSGGLTAFPRPLAGFKGPTFKRRGKGKGGGRKCRVPPPTFE